MRFDLHVHTTISPCSRLRLEDILHLARSRGLDGVCLTDHDTMEAARHVREGRRPDGLVVIVGLEYATPQGDFLLYGDFADLSPGLSATELGKIVLARCGAATAAHPCRSWRPADLAAVRQGWCAAVEARNGRDSAEENALAATFWARSGLAAVAGGDAHEPGELGLAPTVFDAPISSRADLVAALRAGLCRPAEPVIPSSRLLPGLVAA